MRRLAAASLAAALCVVAPAADSGDGATLGCTAPPGLLTLTPALTHVAARIRQHEKLTIVAVGSSSTRGYGASTPAMSYPSRLAVELGQRLPTLAVRVINRGKGGEEIAPMLARLDRDVIAEHPDLVIWQLGTNTVLRHDDVAAEREPIKEGIVRLKEAGSDVVLMDMQYTPRVVARPAAPAMEQLIAEAAKRNAVGLFRRFELMRQWQAGASPEAAPMVAPDGLHMNDRGYGCLAVELADALAANWRLADKVAARDPADRDRRGLTDIIALPAP
jgi:lysophospholipase L1-like esterase